MDLQETEIFTQEHQPIASTSTAAPTKPKQTTLKKRPNAKLGFTSAPHHQPKKTKQPSNQVIELVDSEDETTDRTWREMQSTTLLNLPVKTIVDLADFTHFSGFMEVLLTEDVPIESLMLMPTVAVVIMMAIFVNKNPMPNISKAEILATLLNFQLWKCPTLNVMQDLKTKLYSIPVCRIPNTDDSSNLFDTYMIILGQIYWKTTDCLENTPLSCISDIWEAVPPTSRTYVSLRDAKSLLNFMLNSRWDSSSAIRQPESSSELYRNTATTSTSCTPALTQTQLVAVPGSVIAPSGGHGDELDIDDEFSSLTSKLSTGRISLDISLQKDTQSKTAKAHVIMEDYVYELKMYKKEDIRNLDRSQWYTRVHVKAVGTVKQGHPTKKKLDGLVGDLMADLKTKSNLRMEKSYTYGQKH
ncbi:uncharacterized protein LOC126847619 [Adelges cooleyi]|uniref:uncharacterized protein LOC126847618 n=1 Tax=Adelges cooleyi TaxID=133065 RepID=UPI00217F7BC7|nr:uncharacterized protein LOC126847618 [Adelges cooleyi]XP_050443883.1 uncharacterized protein LOC126847619 [Adelges cooleyi]